LATVHQRYRHNRTDSQTCAGQTDGRPKRYTKKPKNVTSHVFAKTTHVVAAPCGFACVVIPRRSYIFRVSSKCVQGFWSPWGRNLPIPITLAIGFYNSLHHIVIIRPHRILHTRYVVLRPIVTDLVPSSVRMSVGRSVTLLNPAKTAEPMPLGLRTLVGPESHVLDEVL